MKRTFKLENIEQMRLREGIDDIELRESIRQLQIGDCVYVTFLDCSHPKRSKTVLIRLVAIHKNGFGGKLMQPLDALGPSDLRVGSLVTFRESHVHSVHRS